MNEQLLAEARTAQERLIDAERDAEVARAEFHRAVRRLHLHGASLRELAACLGLSHQRVHQIVAEAGGSRRWVRVRPPGRTRDPALMICTFCGATQHTATQHTAAKLIAGPHVYICDACIAAASDVVTTGQPAGTTLGVLTAVKPPAIRPTCSFCGKNRDQAPGLAVLPTVTVGRTAAPAAVCAECLALCREILAEQSSLRRAEQLKNGPAYS